MERLVRPTVEEPIREQWTLVQAAVLQLREPGKAKGTNAAIERLGTLKTSGLAIIAGPDVSHDGVSAVASILEVIANPEQARLGLREILRSRRSEDQIEGQEKILGEGVEKHRRNHHHCHTPIQK